MATWPILEGIVTTRTTEQQLHLAPMGPRVDPDWQWLLLRPFPSSNTAQNLLREKQGVFHVTDDVLLLAQAAVGKAPLPATIPAQHVHGFVLADACRAYEFRIEQMDLTQERLQLIAKVVHTQRFRDFWGLHRARHAVLEAAILVTRVHLTSKEQIEAEFARLKIIVDKTAGPQEAKAFAFLQQHLQQIHRQDASEHL